MGNRPYYHDTLDGRTVQLRVTFNKPGMFKKDTLVSGYIKGSEVNKTQAIFKKWFKNQISVIHFDQKGKWEQPVKVAAKVDFKGMSTNNLYIYGYDREKNVYVLLAVQAHSFDSNGYFLFTTEFAGDIIISDGPLQK